VNTLAKILIVDDEPLNVDLLEQELEDLGYQTMSATNGQDALAKATAEAPDLILLDVMMPKMDGFTVCRLLKEKEATQLIPVIFMTALGEKEHRISGIKAGGYDFFTKPPDRQVLHARIQNAVEMKQAVDRKLKEHGALAQTFHQEGEYWTLTYEGKVVRVKDSAGLHYLAYLLRYPHRRIHVLELIAAMEGPPEGLVGQRHLATQEDLPIRVGLGDAGEFLDPQAKAAYKTRLRELQETLEDAQADNDVGRIAKAQEEMELLTHELLRSLRLGGKSRRAASSTERARINIQRSIKITVEKVAEYHQTLGAYLAHTIHTGTYCSYSPDVRIPSPWGF
jgi:DNA-binding response OmpR family regulator